MSENNDGAEPKPTETEQFARMFSEFMRHSLAHTQQVVPANPPDPKPEVYKVDSTPLVLGFKLNGENYPLWAVLIKKSISSRGMVSHVTGVPPPPLRTDPDFARWQQADNCVFTWLVQNLEQKLVSRISQYPTAKHVWDSLEVTYASGSDKIQVYDLYRKATTLKQRDESLEEVWATLQDIWVTIDQKKPNRMIDPTDIKTYDQEVQEQRLYQFMVALNDKYEDVKKEILRSDPLPSVEAAYALLRREDARTNILRQGDTSERDASHGVGAGLAARRPWQNQRQNPQGGGGCRDGGNWNRRSKEDKLKLVCSYCGRKKHTRETCFELVGFPEWWEERTGKPPPPHKGGKAAAAIAGGEAIATVGGNSGGVANVRGGGLPAADDAKTGTALIGIAKEKESGSKEAAQQSDGNGKLGLRVKTLTLKPSTLLKSETDPHISSKLHLIPRSGNPSLFRPPKSQILPNRPQKNEKPENSPILCKNSFQPLENLPSSYALCASSVDKSKKWIFDCGATDTMTYDASDITDMHGSPQSYIQTASGELTEVKGAGTVRISPTLTLSNCLISRLYHINCSP